MRMIGLISFWLSLSLYAKSKITVQIYDVDYGFSQKDDILVFLNTGMVAKVHQSNKHLLKVMSSKSPMSSMTLSLDKNRYITAIIPAEEAKKNIVDQTSLDFLDYIPTTVKDMSVAKAYFHEARYYEKESQCYNRAMIWSYEWWKNHSLKSNKLLIYFTRNYIRRNNFEWWFHIAPYIHVVENEKVVERVMDIKYTSGPLPFKDWTNIFMNNNYACPVITKYSDYADFPYSGDCFIQRTNMFTYQPADLQMNEAWGYTKDQFIIDEIRAAYLEAFNEGKK